jgi:hypothetical protein
MDSEKFWVRHGFKTLFDLDYCGKPPSTCLKTSRDRFSSETLADYGQLGFLARRIQNVVLELFQIFLV